MAELQVRVSSGPLDILLVVADYCNSKSRHHMTVLKATQQDDSGQKTYPQTNPPDREGMKDFPEAWNLSARSGVSN